MSDLPFLRQGKKVRPPTSKSAVLESFHSPPNQVTAKKVVPFITGGYSLLFGNSGANGVNFGGGVNWWMRDRLALRLEARDHIFPVSGGTTPQAWEFRIGFSFR